MVDFLEQLDTKWFLFLNSKNSPAWDFIMWHISATKTWIPLYAFVLFFVFRKLKWQGLITLLFLILLVVLTDQVSTRFFKNVFERLRPCHNPDIQHLAHIVNDKCGGKFGFVSSHAANTFGFAMFCSLFFKNKAIAFSLFIWAAIVSYSRIYLGVHFPFDVIGGALLGIVFGFATFKAYKWALSYYQKRKKPVKTGS